MRAIWAKFGRRLILAVAVLLATGAPAYAEQPTSCPEAVAQEESERDDLPAIQQLCIDYLTKASDKERYEMIGSFLVNKQQNHLRFIKAVELNPLLAQMEPRTLVRANAYRAKEHDNPDIDLSNDDLEGYIEDAKRVGDEVALAALYYSATVERASTDMNLEIMQDYLTSGLEIVEKNGFGTKLQYVYTNGLGNVAFEDGRLVDALNFYLDAKELSNTLSSARAIVANINIGRVFALLGAHEDALNYYRVSKRVLDAEGANASPNHQVNLLIYMGESLFDLGQFDAADQAFIDASLIINEQSKTPFGSRMKVFNQRLYAKHAETAVALGDVPRAVTLAEAAAAIEDQQQSAFVRADVKSWLASVYAERGEARKARDAMADAERSMMADGRSWTILKTLEDERRHIFEYAKNMATAAASLGIGDMAVQYAGLSAELSEMLMTQRDLAAIANAESLLEIRSGRERLAVLADLNAQQDTALRQSRISQWLAFALAAMAAVVAFLVYRFYRAQRALADSRALYLKDTHHRAKNNLQLVTSLLSMSLRRMKDPALEADKFREIRDQTNAMAALHDHLQELPPEETTSIRADEYFANLTHSLEEAYNAAGRIDTTAVEALRIDVNRITPICLITTEIIANSFKHLGNANVAVSLSCVDEPKSKRAILVIRDDGAGFSPHDAKRPGSVGMELIHDLAEQIDGVLELDTGPEGTAWTLKFPLAEPVHGMS